MSENGNNRGWFGRLKAGLSKSSNKLVDGIASVFTRSKLDDEAIEMMLAAGTFLVPTLVAPQGVLDAVDRGISVPQYAIARSTSMTAPLSETG